MILQFLLATLAGVSMSANLKVAEDMPSIQWPRSFETVLSTNDPGLNLTEVLYFVRRLCLPVIRTERSRKFDCRSSTPSWGWVRPRASM